MLSKILENACLGNLRVEQLSSLAHAADCLANAATALSEAARAVTESLTSETESKSEQDDEKDTASARDSTPENPELPTDLNLILLNPVPDPIAPPTESEIDQSEEHREEAGLIEELLLKGQITGTENNEPMSWEATETEEAHATNNINLVEPAEESQEPDVTSNNLHAELPAEVDDGVDRRTDSLGIPAETEPLIDPEQSYRIIVENETDVLLWLCALVQKDQRIICYMPCGTPPLAFYKRLVESVTNIPVYFPERMGSARRDAAYKKYLESDNSVVLIPGTLSPNIVMEGANTWVIHVGWPPNRERCVAQIKNHQAKHNVILACTSDVNLYPSSVPLIAQTLTWPKDGDSVNALRQLFDQSLANIPDDLKEKVYADWIQSHGVYGPRYVKSWNPTMLVQRANRYLFHVVKYRCKSLDSGIPEEKLLPEVSLGFVAQNLLESAVQEAGVLRVKHDSGINHISSLAQADFKPPTPTLSEVDTSIPSTPVAGPSSESARPRARPRAEIPREQLDFKQTPGHTYFTFEEEFDAMPLVCFIAGKYEKTVCFLEGQGSLRHYQRLFSRILRSKFLVVTPEATNSDQANAEAALSFINSSVPAMLLLTYSTTNLPLPLRENRVGCCVYWGFHLPLKQAKKHRDQLVCSSTSIIISPSQQVELKRQSTDIIEHPSARSLLDLSPKSLLWPMRNAAVSVLMSEEATVKGLYVNRIYGLGTVSRAERSAEEVIRMANRYAAKVLLRGVPEDGSESFPPVAGRLSIPRTVVERFSLQPAVSAGLVSIG